ncbi:MAG: exosome complex exonuclease Rrp41 [Candidatus Aenigmatarchaeota archaeon]|nr:MAG: exosome complex exonuclease Rrp41 [Candidatus Aenigmarchaeota archaeon]
MLKRADGRKPEELRPITIRAGVIEQANGSALVQMGKTTAVAAVYGPKSMYPRHLRLPDRAVLETIYAMVPFSTKERVRPGPSRRSIELCKVIRQALEPVIFLEEFPKAQIDVYIDILQADAGTRTAAINAASVALADAGVPMRDLVSAVAVGKIDGEYVLDLTSEEEDLTACDLPVAVIPRKEQVTLMQLDGDVSPEDVKKLVRLALKGCQTIYQKQREALKRRWIDEGAK